MITVILSGYKRPHALQQQYEAIKNQTVDDVKILLWTNSPDGEMQDFPKEVVQNCESTMSNSNYGVWGRFSLALNASTKYVNIIDDDTIPGRKWLENCLMTMESHRGPLGTRGIIMNPEDDRKYPYNGYEIHGWHKPNENVERVDMLCHSWFFETDWLRYFWVEAPIPAPHHFGEDMHLSYVAQKHLGLNSYVPPHPIGDKEMWGSQPETGLSLGEDENAISGQNVNNQGMNRYWNFIRDKGYKLMKEQE